MYTALDIKARPVTSDVTTLLPRKGLNTADTPQLLSMDYAIKMVNYLPKRYGLEKRAGLNKIFDRAGGYPITMLFEYTDGVWLFAYDTKLEAYNEATEAFTTIKDDFTAGTFDGDRYGDYAFVTNEIEKPYRISQTLNYDGQTANFTAGEILTGGTSGATAVILEDSDSGATGTLTLGNITGTFEDNEAITDSATGAAVVNGTIGYTATEVTNAPICGGLKAIGSRLYAFRLESDSSAVQYSEVDDGSNPPFDAWSNTTAVADGGKVNYRNAGAVRSIAQLGQITVVFSDRGFYAFYINQLDSAGTLKKVEVIQNYTEDFGGARGAIETPQGIFYLNEAGLWQMVAVGATDEPMSRQQYLTSNLLKSSYFKDIDQTSADLVHDVNQNIILVTCAKNAAFNNLVIGYDLDMKAFFTFNNWNINRFAKSGQEVYGASSVSTKMFKLFDGYSDDGLDIGTECVFEVPMKTLYSLNDLTKIYGAGLFSPSSEIHIKTDIYNWRGDKIEDKTDDLWSTNTTGTSGGFEEWGTGAFGEAAFGGAYEDADTAGLIESFGGSSTTIRNFQRLRIKLTGGDKLKHILTWLSAKITTKQPIRRRNFTALTT